MKYILLFTTFLFAGALEVDGDLTVLGNVNAPGLGGMKPERIYQIEVDNFWSEDIVVPDGKLWMITPASMSGISIQINGSPRGYLSNSANSIFPAFPFQIVNLYSTDPAIISIYEYSISGSGTDQGMNYVEP